MSKIGTKLNSKLFADDVDMSKKPRHFAITFWEEPKEFSDKVRYCIYGEEVCPESKKVHWQAYAEFTSPQRFSTIYKHFGVGKNKCHVGARYGTRIQARDYCKKDKKFIEHGTWISGQGARGDLHEVASALMNGTMILEDVIKEDPALYCRYRNGFKDMAQIGLRKRSKEFRHVKTTILSGPTGCGKTRKAVATNPEDYFKISGSQLKWFDGYNGEKTLVIDEYLNDVKIGTLLGLLDGYQYRLPIKGSFSYAEWDEVFITTNLRKCEFHGAAKKASRDALWRRANFVNMWDI